MSSRLFPPGDSHPAQPMLWRSVGAPAQDGLPYVAEVSSNKVPPPDSQIGQRLREAHAAGVREGEAAGRSRAAAELQPVIEKMSQAIAEMGGLRARLRREAEADLVRLAVAIAQRILRRELVADPEALHGLILGALEKLHSQEVCRVRVHPAQAALVKACLERVNPTSGAEIVADPAREPGTVIFETARGNLDASVESQLREIERGLADRLNRSQ